MLREPGVPALAGLLGGGEAADRGQDLALALEDLQGEAGRGVPGCG